MSACSDLRARVESLARLRWLTIIVTGGMICLGVIGGLLLVLLSADHVLDLPPALRLIALLLWIGVAVAVVVSRLVRPALNGARVEGAAQAIERQGGIRDNRVVNACQFAGRRLDPDGSALAEAIASDGAQVVDGLDRQAFLRLRGCVNVLLFLGMLALAWGAYLASYPHHVAHALARLLQPLEASGEIGDAVIELEPYGEVRRYAGDAITVDATVTVLTTEETVVDPELVLGEIGGAGAAGDRLAMALTGDGFRAVARDLRRDRVLWVEALGARSAPLQLRVLPAPVASGIGFVVSAPDYAGGATSDLPGPSLDVLADSRVRIRAQVDGVSAGLRFVAGGADVPMEQVDGSWQAEAVVRESGSWQVRSGIPEDLRDPSGDPHLVLASGSLRIAADRAPQVRIDVSERNRFLAPGARLSLPVVASDDLGLQSLTITAADSVDEAEAFDLRRWPYLGPPGRDGSVRESLEIELDPRRFEPGRSYIVRALARDFRPPAGQVTRSEPVVIRIYEAEQLRAAGDAAFQQAFATLKQAITAQDRARGRTAQVRANRPPAGEPMQAPASALAEAQTAATALIASARDQFAASAGSERYHLELERLHRGDCVLAARSIAALPTRSTEDLDAALTLLRQGQDEIHVRLLALLGRIAGERPSDGGRASRAQDAGHETDPKSLADALGDGLGELMREQRKLLDRARTLADRGPMDLSLEEEAILGELARRQDELLRYLEDQLDDLARLPDQDFADSSLKEEWNEVYQEMQLAADALFQQKIELAVPHEQAGLESASEMKHNLERWLATAPDRTQWSMEEPMSPPDAPLADLPGELEDLVGELLDDLESMDPAVEDASSSWMDSIDKGAGWDAADGPISNMSAKGVTGNILPNHNEVGGRAGEGRQGRSHGQMVEAGAEGKGGRETPTRLTPSPFEQGSVEDTSTAGTGGATGGGKQSGFAGEGLVGPTPPPQLKQRMQRVSEQQAGIRQQAGELALELRHRGYPSGDLEAAVAALRGVAAAATRGDAVSLRQAHHQAIDALVTARRQIATEARVRREHAVLPENERELSVERVQGQIPAGYETMVETYYQALQGREQR